MAKNGVSQEYIGPSILEKIQMYILTRAEILYTLCYEIPCSENSSQSQLIAKEELKTKDVEVNKTTKTTSKFSYSQTNGPTDNDDSVNYNNR